MKGKGMRGLGTFQMGQMKQRDARVFLLCQHLRSAIDTLEQIVSQPFHPPQTSDLATSPPQVSSTAPAAGRELMPARKLAYSIKEAADAVGLCRSSIYRLMATGELPSIKIGKRRLIAADVLNRLVTGK